MASGLNNIWGGQGPSLCFCRLWGEGLSGSLPLKRLRQQARTERSRRRRCRRGVEVGERKRARRERKGNRNRGSAFFNCSISLPQSFACGKIQLPHQREPLPAGTQGCTPRRFIAPCLPHQREPSCLERVRSPFYTGGACNWVRGGLWCQSLPQIRAFLTVSFAPC